MKYYFLSNYDIIQILLFFLLLLICIKPLGSYIAKIYSGQYTFLEPLVGPIEDLFHRIASISPYKEMTWREYAVAVILSNCAGFIVLFLILRFQTYLPLNPQHFPNLSNDLAFNVAASFTSNTNWQAYSGESTLSYFSQMCGLTLQNFLSASTGLAVAIALTRGLSRKNMKTIGNFWSDWLRGTLYIFLPLSIILAILLGSQGVIQNFKPYFLTTTIENATQTIPGGPVASQIAIKQLGSNGGGFFNTNSAHPFENPTPFSNLLELLAILLIPIALCYTFGIMINDKRQGWAILIAMFLIYFPMMLFCVQQENTTNSRLADLHVVGPNMEGKEVRFGITNSALWASATTASSNGSVNSMHDSYTPLGGLIPLLLLMLSEVIFGGIGSGLYGMLTFIFVTVFLAGLMAGRTPEYLGKKIQSFEIKMACIAIFIPVIALLFGTAIAVSTQAGQSGIYNPGAQGFTEILYAFASTSGNNGSSFAGIHANMPFYNTILSLVMLFSRYWVIIPVLAIAGSLVEKNITPVSLGTLPTFNAIFIFLLISVIILVGLLTYTPAITLAPLSEYFQLK